MRLVTLGAVLLAAAGCESRRAAPATGEAPHGQPATRAVNVYFRRDASCNVVPVSRVVNGTRALDFAWAALEALLEGPTDEEAAGGLRSAVPDREQVWRYMQSRVAFGYDPPYPGEEVNILDVREEAGGVLFVNLSPEIEAYGGGADRLCALIRQLESTVTQFDEYHALHIAVDGNDQDALQP